MSAFPWPGRAQQQVQDVSFKERGAVVKAHTATHATAKSARTTASVNSGKNRRDVVPVIGKTTGKVVAHTPTMAPWPTAMDLSPNVFWRSALFRCQRASFETVTDRAGRTEVRARSTGNTPLLVASTKQYVISYTGDLLRQFDAQVFLLCCATARAAGDMGAYVAFRANEWNRLMNKKPSGKNNALIRASLLRLARGNLEITINGVGIAQQRFISLYEDTSNLKQTVFHIRIDPLMQPLFASDATEIDVERSGGLRHSLSRWVHNFYSTHNGDRDLSVADLNVWSGTELPLFTFRKELKKAIAELQTCAPTAFFAADTHITAQDELHVVKVTHSRIKGHTTAISAPAPELPQSLAPRAIVRPTATPRVRVQQPSRAPEDDKPDMSPAGRARAARARLAL